MVLSKTAMLRFVSSYTRESNSQAMALRVRDVSQDPVERGARASKRIDDGEMCGFGKCCGDAGDVPADAIA